MEVAFTEAKTLKPKPVRRKGRGRNHKYNLIARLSKRAEVAEVMATFDEAKLGWFVKKAANWGWARDKGRYQWVHDAVPDAEEAVQKAMADVLAYTTPKTELRADGIDGLILWNAYRNMGNGIKGRIEMPDVQSLEWVVARGDREDVILADTIPDPMSGREGMALLEAWYVGLYIRHLLTISVRTDNELCEELGVRRHVIESVRAQLREELALKPWEPIIPLTGWTRKTSLAALRYYADEHGEPPTVRLLIRDRVNLPPPENLVRLFGSRAEAYRAAGLTVKRQTEGADRQELLERVVELALHLGEWPSQKQMLRTDLEDFPSSHTYQRFFGSTARNHLYEAACRELPAEAMVEVPRPPKFYKGMPAIELAEAVKSWAEENGRWPKFDDFKHDGELPNLKPTERAFGSCAGDLVRAKVEEMLGLDDQSSDLIDCMEEPPA